MVLPYDYNGFQAPPNLATTDHFDLLGVDPYRPTRHTYDELLQMARRVTGLLYAMESFAVPPTLPVRYSVQEAETMVQYLEEGQTFGGPDFVVAAFYTLQHGRYAYYESTSTWNPHTAIPPFRVRTEVTVPMPGRLPLVPTPESSFPGEPVDDSSGPPSSAASDDFEPGGRFGQGNATMNPHFRPPPSSKSPTPSTGAPEYDNEPQHAIAAGEPTQTPAGSPPSRTNSLPRYRERTPARPTDQPGQSTDRHRSPSRRQSVSPARCATERTMFINNCPQRPSYVFSIALGSTNSTNHRSNWIPKQSTSSKSCCACSHRWICLLDRIVRGLSRNGERRKRMEGNETPGLKKTGHDQREPVRLSGGQPKPAEVKRSQRRSAEVSGGQRRSAEVGTE